MLSYTALIADPDNCVLPTADMVDGLGAHATLADTNQLMRFACRLPPDDRALFCRAVIRAQPAAALSAAFGAVVRSTGFVDAVSRLPADGRRPDWSKPDWSLIAKLNAEWPSP